MAIADTFDRADSTTSLGTASDGGTWTVDSGVFGILTNRGYMTSSPTVPGMMRRNTNQVAADVTITLTRTNTNGFSHFYFSWNPGTQTGYRLQYDSSATVTVQKMSGATPTSLGTVSVTSWSASSTTLRVTYVSGTGVITVFQGGVSKGTATDGTPITSAANSWTGFAATQVNSSTGETYDNFSAVSTAPAVGKAPSVFTRGFVAPSRSSVI